MRFAELATTSNEPRSVTGKFWLRGPATVVAEIYGAAPQEGADWWKLGLLPNPKRIGKTLPYGALGIDVTMRQSEGPRNPTVDPTLVARRFGSDRKKAPQKPAYILADFCVPKAEVGF